MHAAAYHVPQMVEKNDNIKQFSGQGKKILKTACYSKQLCNLEIYISRVYNGWKLMIGKPIDQSISINKIS